ncbi:hypothetical protein BJX66DRAFT_332257 [Aspergillus keveii]|uniref:Uncharacterized protein n=1 Tax=Aspergillus keveii TaxID=714993 RepID=A0ABR4GM71_9EURO
MKTAVKNLISTSPSRTTLLLHPSTSFSTIFRAPLSSSSHSTTTQAFYTGVSALRPKTTPTRQPFKSSVLANGTFPDIKTPSNARLLPDLIELMPLCDVYATKIEALKNIAYATLIRNDEADYSCQDYVLDVLGRLEEHGIIDPANEEYKRNKMAVVAKQQSWD